LKLEQLKYCIKKLCFRGGGGGGVGGLSNSVKCQGHVTARAGSVTSRGRQGPAGIDRRGVAHWQQSSSESGIKRRAQGPQMGGGGWGGGAVVVVGAEAIWGGGNPKKRGARGRATCAGTLSPSPGAGAGLACVLFCRVESPWTLGETAVRQARRDASLPATRACKPDSWCRPAPRSSLNSESEFRVANPSPGAVP
jgi:hypothetical protein